MCWRYIDKSGRENKTTPIGIIDGDKYEHNNRVYPYFGFCPSLSAREYKDPIKVLIYEREYRKKNR